MAKVEELKIITLGNSSVGKSSFIIKYVDNAFSFDYITTLGVDYKQKKIKLKNEKEIRLRIFDTAGQERFKSVSVSFIKKADGVILIYDIGKKESFDSINNWIENIRDIGRENLPVILVGNKCDLPNEEREVSLKDGEEKANEFKIPFFETSCKEGINVNQVFEKLIEEITSKSNWKKTEFKSLNDNKKKGKCC